MDISGNVAMRSRDRIAAKRTEASMLLDVSGTMATFG